MAIPGASFAPMHTFNGKSRFSSWVVAAGLGLAVLYGYPREVSAHVGVVNTQIPYAVAGKSYELVLAVPHGLSLIHISEPTRPY